MSNSLVSPFALHPMPSGWIAEYLTYGYYDGPTHGVAKTVDDRLYLFKMMAGSDSMQNRLFGFWWLPDHLREQATKAFGLQRTQDLRARDIAAKVFEEALATIDDRYGAQILAITSDFSEFHAVELVEAKTPDDS